MALKINGEGEAARLIGEIAAQIEAEGGWFNPDLEIRVQGADVSVISSNPFEDLRSVIRVPIKSMPLLEDFDITVSNGKFSATPKNDQVSAKHIRIMGLMLDVFNVLDKLPQWRDECPWFSLEEHRPVLDHLLTGRPLQGRVKQLREKIDGDDLDALAADTFMGSRKFNLNPELLKKVGYEGRETGGTTLMPIIDYFNHAMSAQGFKIHDVPLPVSMRIQSRPDPETGELFVRYNVFDALDTYLFYGFVDAGVGYLASVPCEIKFGDKTLKVIATSAGQKGKLPDAIKDLRIFMPAIQKGSEHSYAVTKLIIPGKLAPRALRRVLQVFLNSMKMDKAEIPGTIKEIEASLLDQNEAWWQALADKAADVPEGHAIHDLYRTTLAHIADYRARIAEMG